MGAVRTIARGGARWYVKPDGSRVPGVTSIIDMLPKPHLVYWAARMTAEAALDNLAAVHALASDREGAIDYLKNAHVRYTRGRARLGSAAHDMFERMLRGEVVRHVGMELEPYRRHFAEFLDRVQPELVAAEDVAWSDRHGYAGSPDAIVRVDGEIVIMDWKTSRDVYPSVALQLAAYAHADYLIADGTEMPMPQIEAGAVLHVVPERWELRPVNITAPVFQVFCALREVFNWEKEGGIRALGRPVESGGLLVTGTERRKGA